MHSCPGFRDHSLLSRRALLRIGGLGTLGLTLPKLWGASGGADLRVRAKSVIFLFQWGGPSHVDMFDLKPKANEEHRSPYKGIRTSCPDIEICEHLPRLARIMDRFTVIRSMSHKMTNHNSAGYYALTGHAPPTDDQRLRDSVDLYPAYGSVVDKLLPNAPHQLPTFVSYPHVVSDGSRTPGQHASFLGKRHDPLFIPRDPAAPDFQLPELSLPDGLDLDRVVHRRGLQGLLDRQSRLMEYSTEARGMDPYYDRSIAMLQNPAVRRAFNLAEEPQAIRESYGPTTYGQGCLLARRLVESGVKFVSVYFDKSIGGRTTEDGGWDTHGFDNTRMFPIIEKRHLPITEQTLPTLILDLERRGMLDDTLVVWMGEFGRTPKINKNISRDHWPQCYTTLLAGGGTKAGYVYGASDETGAKPITKPTSPEDLAATIYHLMGIDPRALIHDTQNRPLMISSGNPVLDVVA